MGTHITDGVTEFMGNQHAQGAITVVGDANAIGDAVEAVAVVALLTGIDDFAEYGASFCSDQERLCGKSGLAHLAAEGEGQGIGGTAQIHLINALEAVQGAAAVALHHQEHVAGGVVGDIADLVLTGAAAQQVEMLFDRGAGGGIDRQDAGELRRTALGCNTIVISVDIQRALHECIQQAVLGVEGHAFNTAVAPAIAIVGGQAVDCFSADHTAVLRLQLGFLTQRDVALDQIAGVEIKNRNLAAVFVADGKHLALAQAVGGDAENRDGL